MEQLASSLTNLNTDSTTDQTQGSQYRPITGFQTTTSQRSKMSSAYRSSNRVGIATDGNYKAVSVDDGSTAEMKSDAMIGHQGKCYTSIDCFLFWTWIKLFPLDDLKTMLQIKSNQYFVL